MDLNWYRLRMLEAASTRPVMTTSEITEVIRQSGEAEITPHGVQSVMGWLANEGLVNRFVPIGTPMDAISNPSPPKRGGAWNPKLNYEERAWSVTVAGHKVLKKKAA